VSIAELCLPYGLRRATAAGLCALVSGHLGALRRLCEDAGLDAEEDFIAEIISDFDELATRLTETAKWRR
jgi:hypothetical protein